MRDPAAGGEANLVRVPACGRVLPRHEIRLVDEHGDELLDRHVDACVSRSVGDGRLFP
ncbi:MAG: hypothetical protein IPN78_03250 [Candidatus Accumulibacter sp.]|nr:hypothetical protein [Candidatus Accumulibacter propinquus]